MIDGSWFLIGAAIVCFTLFFLLRRKGNKQQKIKDAYDPFKLWEMKEQLKCKKCGKTWEIAFKRFDYIYQKITDARAKHKAKHKDCDGEVEVSGIWYEYRNETPEEKKWKEYEKRFR